MKKPSLDIVAAIDVGSNSIRMITGQIYKDGKIVYLDDVWKPTNVGKDTFSYGRIQVETIHDTCDVLNGFVKLMRDYNIRHYRAVCTSGIREAENREYVLEQIRLRTGLEVEVINNAEERFLMFKAIRDFLPYTQKNSNKDTIIVDIRSGGVEISVYSEGNLKFTEYIRVGSLRLREILADLERRTLEFPSIMEEFIESRIDFLKPRIEGLDIKNFVGLGGELNTVIGLCNAKDSGKKGKYIRKEDLEKLYSSIHSMTTEQIIDEYGLQMNQAEILLPSVILLYSFLNMTSAKGIYAPMVSLRHGLLADMADESLNLPGKSESINDVISSVWYIGQKYFIDEVHCAYIEKIALTIFDQTTKIHRLGERERLYLRVASILHDVGKYVNLNQHDVHSYNIILFQDIMGLSNRELKLVANIARYHSEEIPKLSDENYAMLSIRDQILVSKLAAILRFAEALDISHKQKIEDVEIVKSGNELVFKIYSKEDILLEEWSFESNITFFEEVMGNKPILKHRRLM